MGLQYYFKIWKIWRATLFFVLSVQNIAHVLHYGTSQFELARALGESSHDKSRCTYLHIYLSVFTCTYTSP